MKALCALQNSAQMLLVVLVVFVLFLGCENEGSSGTISDADTDTEGTVCTQNSDCPSGTCDTEQGICVSWGNTGDEDDTSENSDVVVDDGRMIVVTPLIVDFGVVQFQQDKTEYITVSNSSQATENATVTKIRFGQSDVSDFSFTVSMGGSELPEEFQPVTLEPGKGLTIEVVYNPQDLVPDEGYTLQIASDDRENPLVDVELVTQQKGEARLVPMSVDDDENEEEIEKIDYGEEVIYGSFEEYHLRIYNRPEEAGSNQVLRITQVTLDNGEILSGPFTLSFDETVGSISSDNPVNLLPNQALDVFITFRPPNPLAFDNTLRIVNNAATDNLTEIPIEASSKFAEDAWIVVEPEELDFGEVQYGQVAELPLTVTNLGLQPLEITELEFSDVGSSYFGFNDDPMIYTAIGSEASLPIFFTFSPDSNTGAQPLQEVKIFSNASNTPSGSITVKMRASTSDPEMLVSEDEIIFDNARVGEPVRETITVKNIGNGNLSIFNIQKQLPSHPEFFVENISEEMPAILEGRESLTFDIVYDPLDTADDVYGIEIIHNDHDLFEEGDTTRSEFLITVRSTNTVQYELPVVKFKVHNEIAPVIYDSTAPDPWNGAGFRAGSNYLIDVGEASFDPDGGDITDCKIELQSPAPLSQFTIEDTDVCAVSFTPDREGSYSFRAMVRDDDDGTLQEETQGMWSAWKNMTITVDKPDTLILYLGDINFCSVGLQWYDLVWYSSTDQACGPSQSLCPWGPEHSGPCNFTLGAQSGWTTVSWDYGNLDGDYSEIDDATFRVEVSKGFALFGEHVKIMMERNGRTDYYWQSLMDFSQFLNTMVFTIQFKREKGIWKEPHSMNPEANFDCSNSSRTFDGEEGQCTEHGDCCSSVCGADHGVPYCLEHCKYNNDCVSNCCKGITGSSRVCVPAEMCEEE